jgi:hypothetical protein
VLGQRTSRRAAVDLVETLTATVRSTPEGFVLLVATGVGAAWATASGTLPGENRVILGPLVEGLLWALVYVGLGLAYLSIDSEAEPSRARRVLRTIGLCVLLALLSAQLCNFLSASLFAPWIWGKLFYSKRLVAPLFLVFWCATLLPRETRSLVHAARSNSAIAPLPALAVLLASAATLVSCADLAFELSGTSAVESALKVQVITHSAWTANVLILFSAYALVLALTSRVGAALLVITPLYIALGLSTLVKIRYMHSAVQPLDLLRIGEFLPLVRSFFGTGVVVATLGTLGLWIAALALVRNYEPYPISPLRRGATALLSLAVLVGVPGAYFVEPAPWLWRDSAGSRSAAKVVILGLVRAVVGPDRDREFRETAREAGFLRSFISELPAAIVPTPANYSPAIVANIASKYCRPGTRLEPVEQPLGSGRRPRVNLILYIVESFMDPVDLGLHYTSDPIPNINALRKTQIGGYAIVPEEFGGSPTTEFEALTAMTTSFLPEGSIAYRLYLKRAFPSLPSTLRSLGYATTVVRADPRYFYNHETAYRLLGFDQVSWLDESPGVERGPRGLWPTDQAVANAVIQAAEKAHPFFVLAFASSTHSPYNFGVYKDSGLDVLDAPTRDAAAEVKEYINALRVADNVIGRMVEHFRDQPDSTIIAVLGDHLPPLTDSPLRTFFSRVSVVPGPERAMMRRRVPLLIWANFGLPREQKELSTNALPSYLLEKMRIPPTGFLALSDTVGRRLSIIRGYAKAPDGMAWSWDSLPSNERSLMSDYQLLQYDLLLGKQYSLRTGSSESACGGPSPAQPVSGP